MRIPSKLKSRKLWVTVLAAAGVALAEGLGLGPAVQTALAILAGTYNIGQGVADSGAQGVSMKAADDARAATIAELASRVASAVTSKQG